MTSMSCVITVTRLAWHPREHARTVDVVDDRVKEEGALQPRLVPLHVHEGGVHGPVQEHLVEQDAVDVLVQNFYLIFSGRYCQETRKPLW